MKMASQTAAQSVSKRLQRDLCDLMSYQAQILKKGDETPVTAFPDSENILHWLATIEGPKNTVYEGFTYRLSIDFPKNYPHSPPTVKFVTSCYHPNVDKDGNICLDILKEKWSALMNVRTVLVSLQSLLGAPNIDDPLNGHAAKLWKNQKAYKEMLVESNSQCNNIKTK